jgi:pimeloyl-ACP methyl ester carboxylesterase
MDYVFLHGGGQGGWVWEKLIDTLSFQSGGTYGRALALDVPGCGAKRGRDTAEITVEAIAEELIADIESAGFQNVFMVGHSQAGTIIPLMLERRPDLFARVLYLACVAPAPGKTVQSFRQEMYSPEEQPPPPRATTRQEVDDVIMCATTCSPTKPTHSWRGCTRTPGRPSRISRVTGSTTTSRRRYQQPMLLRYKIRA